MIMPNSSCGICVFLLCLLSALPAFANDEIPLCDFLSNPWLQKPVAAIRAAADSGDVDAILAMATVYDSGKFGTTDEIKAIPPDQTKVIQWYEKGVKLNDWRSQYNLGVCYYQGYGVEKNNAKAKELLELAANSGNEMAQHGMAVYYMNIEIGGKPWPSYKEGAKWHLLAAQGGNWYSQFAIGKLYEAGLGVVRDPIEALKWYLVSASNGHEPARVETKRLENTLTAKEVEAARSLAKTFVEGLAEKRGDSSSTAKAPILANTWTVLEWAAWILVAIIALGWIMGCRYHASHGGVNSITLTQTMFLCVLAAVFPFTGWNKLHIFWVAPAAFASVYVLMLIPGLKPIIGALAGLFGLLVCGKFLRNHVENEWPIPASGPESGQGSTATEPRTGMVKECASCGRSVRTVYGDLTSGNLICATCWKAFCMMVTADAGLILLPAVGARQVRGLIPAVEAVIEAGCGAMMAWEMVEKVAAAAAQPPEAAEAVAKALAANSALLAKGKVLELQPEDVGGTVAQVKALVKALEGPPTLTAATVAAAVKTATQMNAL
jgi:hypothetical protein